MRWSLISPPPPPTPCVHVCGCVCVYVRVCVCSEADRQEDRDWVLALYLTCVGWRLLPSSETSQRWRIWAVGLALDSGYTPSMVGDFIPSPHIILQLLWFKNRTKRSKQTEQHKKKNSRLELPHDTKLMISYPWISADLPGKAGWGKWCFG